MAGVGVDHAQPRARAGCPAPRRTVNSTRWVRRPSLVGQLEQHALVAGGVVDPALHQAASAVQFCQRGSVPMLVTAPATAGGVVTTGVSSTRSTCSPCSTTPVASSKSLVRPCMLKVGAGRRPRSRQPHRPTFGARAPSCPAGSPVMLGHFTTARLVPKFVPLLPTWTSPPPSSTSCPASGLLAGQRGVGGVALEDAARCARPSAAAPARSATESADRRGSSRRSCSRTARRTRWRCPPASACRWCRCSVVRSLTDRRHQRRAPTG